METTHLHTITDGELMASIAEGSSAHYEILYDRYATKTFHYIKTLVNEDSVAEDVAAEAMITVWKQAHTFRRESRVSTWIFGIARHKALDALRKVVRHEQRTVSSDELLTLADPDESPVETIDREQTGAATQRALTKLSKEHQEVLRLAFYEELPYEEMATILEIPVNTVKTRVFYAKQQLKKLLGPLVKKESAP